MTVLARYYVYVIGLVPVTLTIFTTYKSQTIMQQVKREAIVQGNRAKSYNDYYEYHLSLPSVRPSVAYLMGHCGTFYPSS